MRHFITLACGLAGCLAFSGCRQASTCHDYTTPQQAARSFLEAGRMGDKASVRAAVVAAERDSVGHVDYQTIGDYTLTLDHWIDDRHAVVRMQIGPIHAPIACTKEASSWKVTVQGTLQCMRQMAATPVASAPR
jgi:hypothetical protein